MYVVAPFGFLPPSSICWSGSWKRAKLNKSLAVQALLNNLGWSGFFLWHSGAGSTEPAGTVERPPFRALCLYMPVIHRGIAMGTVHDWASNLVSIKYQGVEQESGLTMNSKMFKSHISLMCSQEVFPCGIIDFPNQSMIWASLRMNCSVICLKQRHLLGHNFAPLWRQWSQATYRTADQT